MQVRSLFLAGLIFVFLSSFPSFSHRSPVRVLPVPPADPTVGMTRVQKTVQRGDRLGEILNHYIASDEAHRAVEAMRVYFSPRQVKPGWSVTMVRNSRDFVGDVAIESIDGWRVILTRWHGAWASRVEGGSARFSPCLVSGSIDSSLIEAFASKGLPVPLVISFASIFQWDVDFFRDIRKGDTFSLAYLKDQDGNPGAILFALLKNQGKEFAAIRYDGGYYDLRGVPLKKAFRKAPLDVARITSHFSYSRFHPVLHRRMPHYGVDYAAPTGTPVVATGSGTVVFRGYKRGWGNSVTLRHPNRIRTSYLHLSKFPRGLRVGSRVSEGQVIGYVGQTGLATGPHVDYRISVNGKYVNPLRFQAPPLPPLPQEKRKEFLTVAQKFMDRWARKG